MRVAFYAIAFVGVTATAFVSSVVADATALAFLGVALLLPNRCIDDLLLHRAAQRALRRPYRLLHFGNVSPVAVAVINPGKMWSMQKAPREAGSSARTFLEQAKHR